MVEFRSRKSIPTFISIPHFGLNVLFISYLLTPAFTALLQVFAI